MAKKKLDYNSILTHRKDGRWQKVVKGKCLIDKDPEKLLEKIRDIENPAEIKLTFSSAAENWERIHFEQIGYKAREAYAAPLRRINENFGSLFVDTISSAQIQAFISDIAKRGYARRTVQMHLDIMRMIFNTVIISGYINYNPCTAVKIPRGLPTQQRELPDDNSLEIVKSSLDCPFGLFAFFCLYTGLRRGEALALTYEDIDFQNKVIHVNKAVEFNGNTPKIKSTKTEAGQRDVILLDVLADVLPRGNGLLFCNEKNGALLTKTQYRKRWQKYLDATGLQITAHQLRHGFATILYEAGVEDKDAQELLGHSNIALTRNIYTHIRQQRKKETAAKLNNFVSKTVS